MVIILFDVHQNRIGSISKIPRSKEGDGGFQPINSRFLEIDLG